MVDWGRGGDLKGSNNPNPSAGQGLRLGLTVTCRGRALWGRCSYAGWQRWGCSVVW